MEAEDEDADELEAGDEAYDETQQRESKTEQRGAGKKGQAKRKQKSSRSKRRKK
jgi:hypothetical protein